MDHDFNAIVDQPGRTVTEVISNALVHATHKAFEGHAGTPPPEYLKLLARYMIEGIYAQGWYVKPLGTPQLEPIINEINKGA